MGTAGMVVSLVVAGWLIWALPGPHLAAGLGIGPVDGTMTISSCYEATDYEGYDDGTDCTGVYSPRAGGEPRRRITLDKAATSHRAGSTLEVRLVRGRAYEPSGYAAGTWFTVSGLMLGPFLALSLFFRASARHGEWSHNGDYVLVFIAAELASLVVGFVFGLTVSLALALSG